MFMLSFYGPANDPKWPSLPFESIDAALAFGRQSGQFYDLLNISTGKTISWNELFWQVDDEEWFYDESELLWKKIPGDEEQVEK